MELLIAGWLNFIGGFVSTSDDLQQLLNLKCDELAAAANMFRTILPHPAQAASAHHGEEGRFTESLLSQFLRDSLPARLSVGTGFVVNLDRNIRSYQTDILVYDSSRYAAYLKYGDAVVIPAQAVVAAISVKKKLQYSDIGDELIKLSKVGSMCGGHNAPPPYLCLFGFEADAPVDPSKAAATSWKHLQNAYPSRPSGYSANELVDSVVVLNQYYIRKGSWKAPQKASVRTEAKYAWSGANRQHRNAYLQELVHGIHLRMNGRCSDGSPVQNTAHFAPQGMKQLGSIATKCDNRPPV